MQLDAVGCRRRVLDLNCSFRPHRFEGQFQDSVIIVLVVVMAILKLIMKLNRSKIEGNKAKWSS